MAVGQRHRFLVTQASPQVYSEHGTMLPWSGSSEKESKWGQERQTSQAFSGLISDATSQHICRVPPLRSKSLGHSRGEVRIRGMNTQRKDRSSNATIFQTPLLFSKYNIFRGITLMGFFFFLLNCPHDGLFLCVLKFWIINSIFKNSVNSELKVCVPPEVIYISCCQYAPGVPNQDPL